MGIAISWHSQTGTRTEDNRDCGGVGLRGDEALCVVLDGSTKGPDSGALARQVTRALIDWYVATDQEITAETLTARLREIHGALSKTHPRDSASYMIVHVRATHAVLVLHAGDCLFGRLQENGGIAWLSQPHTLASVTGENTVAEIAGLAARHRLTRSFRAREFRRPDALELVIEEDSTLVIATDGFWAELSTAEQDRFRDGEDMPMDTERDDRSILCIRLRDGMAETIVSDLQPKTDNLYLNRA